MAKTKSRNLKKKFKIKSSAYQTLTQIRRWINVRHLSVVLSRVSLLQARTQSKIGQLYMALRVQQQVIRLDVSVNKTELVNVVDSRCCLGNIELGHLFAEGVLFNQERHHITTRQELHDQI